MTDVVNPGLKQLVINTLRGVCEDKAAPAAAKATAARTLAEIEGLLGKFQTVPIRNDTEGENMSETDIDQEIQELRKRTAANSAALNQ